MALPRWPTLARLEPSDLLARLVPPSPPWIRVPSAEELPDPERARRWCRETADRVAPELQDRLYEVLEVFTDPTERSDPGTVELVQLDGWQHTPTTVELQIRERDHRGLVGLTSLRREGSGENEVGGRLQVRPVSGLPTPVLEETELDTGVPTLGWLARRRLLVLVRSPGWFSRPRVVSVQLFGDEPTVAHWSLWWDARLADVLGTTLPGTTAD